MENGKYTPDDWRPQQGRPWLWELKWGMLIGLTLGLLSIFVIELFGAPAPLPRRQAAAFPPPSCTVTWPISYRYRTTFSRGGHYSAVGPVGHEQQWLWVGSWRLERDADGAVLHIVESREPHDPSKWRHFAIRLYDGGRTGESPSGGRYDITPD